MFISRTVRRASPVRVPWNWCSAQLADSLLKSRMQRKPPLSPEIPRTHGTTKYDGTNGQHSWGSRKSGTHMRAEVLAKGLMVASLAHSRLREAAARSAKRGTLGAHRSGAQGGSS